MKILFQNHNFFYYHQTLKVEYVQVSVSETEKWCIDYESKLFAPGDYF